MWGYKGAAGGPNGVTPFFTATLVDRAPGAQAPPAGGALQQPEGAPALPAVALPLGFWNGRVSFEFCGVTIQTASAAK